MNDQYIDDIREIKDIMQRSSRFISLSGMSGVFAGVIAIGGALAANQLLLKDNSYFSFAPVEIGNSDIWKLLTLSAVMLFTAITFAVLFTTREAQKREEPIWDFQTKRMLVNLSVPLVVGGVVCLIFLFRGWPGVLPSFTLVFYGLALVNVSKYTMIAVRFLGITEILIGITSLLFIEYSLIFWMAGFGLMHILWGLFLHWKRTR